MSSVFVAFISLMISVLPLSGVVVSVYTEVSGDIVTVHVEPKCSVVVIESVFLINVSIANVPSDGGEMGLHSYQFELTYSNTVLEGINVTLPEGHFLTPEYAENIFVVECRVNQTEGSVHLAVTLLYAVSVEPGKAGNGTLVTIAFKAKSVGNSSLSVINPILASPYSQLYECEVVNGYVIVVSPDLNMDGKVDLEDLNLQKEAFGSNPKDSNWNIIADLNKDNVVNILDISLVAKDYGKTV
jgi:hypothetical protein